MTALPAPNPLRTIGRREMLELRLEGPTDCSWVDPGIEATFTNGDSQVTVNGFGGGEGDIRVRFSPPTIGRWQYQLERDGTHVASGTFDCVPSDIRGPVHAAGTTFEYEDGGAYSPFGTTLYAWAHQARQLRKETLATLAAAPFNKVRMCIFPKGMVYNRTNPDSYPFARGESDGWNVHRPNPRFWDELDERITELAALGIQADIILLHPYDDGPDGRWGFSTLGRDDTLTYLRYATRRLAAHSNVWWSLANEYDMLFDYTAEDWAAFGQQVVEEDHVGHLISCHNWIQFFDFELPWITHCSIQSSQVHRVAEWRSRYGKPVILDEFGYEGDLPENWGHLSGFELVHRSWCVVVGGGYVSHGETFLDDHDIVWWAKGGTLRGDAPPRLRFLRTVLEELGGVLTPRPPGMAVDPNGGAAEFTVRLREAFMNAEPATRAHIWAENVAYEALAADGTIIRYLGWSRQSTVQIDLPDGRYTVDLVDVWDASRRTVLTAASGTTTVALPGREGTAVIARPA